MSFFWFLLFGSLAWGLIKTAMLIIREVRFRRLLKWLGIDIVSASRKASVGDIDGLVRDMAIKFRERAYLFCYRVEREIDRLSNEEMHPRDRTAMELYIANVRELLDRAGPFDIFGLTVDYDEDVCTEARNILEPLRAESLKFHSRTVFFYVWLNANGNLVYKPKGTA